MRVERGESSEETELSASGLRASKGERVVELDLELGTKIGRYVLIEQIGRGGMGVIWAAYDPQLDRKVALKLLLMDGVASRTRLEREAQALARVDHTNVVRIHDVGVYEGQVWLAMEFIDGQTLRAWLKAKRPSWREVQAVMLDAGRGLAAAHDKGLVHRDFKPENVMIDGKGRVVVMDFGLVRHEQGATDSWDDEEDEEFEEDEDEDEDEQGEASQLADESVDVGVGEYTLNDLQRGRRIHPRKAGQPSASSSFVDLGIPEAIAEDEDISRPFDTNITRGGAVMGTPAYMAPEQHASIPTDARADQFGFCVTLWEAVYGQRPFVGTSLSQLAMSVSKGEIQDPPRGTKVPQWLRRVMERGMAPKREERYADMKALLDALRPEPRRRWLGAAAIVGVLAVGGAVWAGSATRGPDGGSCEAQGAEITESWSSKRQGQLEAAFMATEAEGAAESWTRTRDYLEDWSSRWANARTGTCVEAQVEGSRGIVEFAASQACLDHQRAGFEQLLGALEEIDADSLHGAVLSAATLPMPAVCAQSKTAPMLVPEEEALAAAVGEQRAALQRAAALRHLGRHQAARELSEAVEDEAERLGWRPLLAEALYERAQAVGEIGSYDAAEAGLEDAFVLAGRANDEVLMAQVAVALARMIGDFQARHQEGLRWARVAGLYLERAGLLDTPEHGELELIRGRIAQLAGDYESAKAALEGAQELLEASLGSEHPRVAGALNSLGNYHVVRGDTAAATQALERARDIYAKALGEEHPRVAVVLNNLGNAYRVGGRNKDALRVYERAYELRLAIYGPEHPNVGTALNNLGTAYITARRYDDALEVMTRALEIREASLGVDHPRVSSTLNNLGLIYFSRGEVQTALGYYERAYELRKQTLGPRHDRVAGSLTNIGDVLFELGETERALAAYEESLDIYREALGAEHVKVVSGLQKVALAKGAAGEHAQAEELMRQARALAQKVVGEQSLDYAYLERDYGELERRRGRMGKAREHYERSLEVLGSWPDPPPGELADLRWQLAKVHDNPQRAKELAKLARDEYGELGQAEAKREVEAWLAGR